MADTDGVPQELKDEVDRIRGEEDGGETEDEVGEVEIKLSRRQAKKQENEERQAAADARAQEILDSAKAAAEEAKQLRAERSKDAERMARLEGLLEANVLNQRQQFQQPVERYEPAENIYRKKMRDANTALAAGKLDDYHDLQREANEALFEEKLRSREAQIMRSIPQPQQVFQKPDWVQAVESQFGDVLMHPNGQNAVVNFHNIMAGQGARATPESLHKAYERAREELGLKPKEDPAKLANKRAMLSGGRPTGNASGKSGGGKEGFVRMPAGIAGNYKELARRAGMSPDDYLRAYAESNPKDVGRE